MHHAFSSLRKPWRKSRYWNEEKPKSIVLKKILFAVFMAQLVYLYFSVRGFPIMLERQEQFEYLLKRSRDTPSGLRKYGVRVHLRKMEVEFYRLEELDLVDNQ